RRPEGRRFFAEQKARSTRSPRTHRMIFRTTSGDQRQDQGQEGAKAQAHVEQPAPAELLRVAVGPPRRVPQRLNGPVPLHLRVPFCLCGRVLRHLSPPPLALGGTNEQPAYQRPSSSRGQMFLASISGRS